MPHQRYTPFKNDSDLVRASDVWNHFAFDTLDTCEASSVHLCRSRFRRIDEVVERPEDTVKFHGLAFHSRTRIQARVEYFFSNAKVRFITGVFNRLSQPLKRRLLDLKLGTELLQTTRFVRHADATGKLNNVRERFQNSFGTRSGHITRSIDTLT